MEFVVGVVGFLVGDSGFYFEDAVLVGVESCGFDVDPEEALGFRLLWFHDLPSCLLGCSSDVGQGVQEDSSYCYYAVLHPVCEFTG